MKTPLSGSDRNLKSRNVSEDLCDSDKMIWLKPAKSTAARFRDILSQVGCVMHDADKVRFVQGLLLSNLILRMHIREQSKNRKIKQTSSVDHLEKLKSRFDDFETRCSGISVLFVLVREQAKKEVYDEEHLSLLCFLIESVKESTKDFWEELPSFMEESL